MNAEVRDETARVEAFSDGVFAIAITLLILEIKVPHEVAAGQLRPALLHLWPSLLAFLTSFFSIGVMWMNHHRLFSLIGRTDQTLLVLNTLLLLGVAFIPFPTGLLAQYLHHRESHLAALIFNVTYFLTAVVFFSLWRYASKNLLQDGADAQSVAAITRQYNAGPIMYGLFLLASFNALLTLIAHFGAAVFFGLPPSWLRRR